jgi:hypothetical protein
MKAEGHIDANEQYLYLAGDVLVGESDDETVLGCIVLVLNLDNEAFAGIVICLAFASPLELNLEALEVGLVLDHFDETLEKQFQLIICSCVLK